MGIAALRRRLPLLAFVLVAVLCLAILGFACACLSDHPMAAVAHALAAIPLLPALVEVWPALAAALLTVLGYGAARRLPATALSPAALQRFLL